jgi:diguanylate cyclase (GGDEF)-like protein
VNIAQDPSILGTLLQTVGVALIAFFLVLLARSVRRVYVTYWAGAWVCLAVALAALFGSFRSPALGRGMEVFYYLGEYAFGCLLFAGVRNFATGAPLGARDLLVVPFALGFALALPRISADFSMRFAVHSPILAGLFAASVWRLLTLPNPRGPRLGLGMMRVALVLLCVDFLQYGPVLGISRMRGIVLPLAYGGYTAIYDLFVEVLLAFGIVAFVMEDVNHDLKDSHDRLASTARMDPLTQSLNRHAFYSLLEEDRGSAVPSGSVAILDVDELKRLNDSFGHASGDAAIRAAAAAIRSVVRADDLVFRWGGDEFLVILPGVAIEEAQRRLGSLDARLHEVRAPGSPTSFSVRLSHGVAPFGSGIALERAIETADAAMYEAKQERRAP